MFLYRFKALLIFIRFNKCHLKCLTRAKLLQPVCEDKSIIHFIVLEDVQATIQGDLPAVIGQDMAGMDCAGAVKLPSEVYTHRTGGVLHLL